MNKRIWVGVLVVIAIVAGAIILSTRERSSGTVTIGAILPLSGDAAAYGKSAQKGIQLAAEEANALGGVNGTRIVVIYEDTQAKPATGVSATQKLINIDKVQAIIGGVASSVTLAAAPLCERNQVALLSPASSSPKISDAGDFIFRNAPSDTLEGGIMAEYAQSALKISRAAVIYVNNEYGAGIKSVFEHKFTGLGGTIVASVSFQQGDTDMRTQLASIKGKAPEAVYLIGYKENGTILKQARELALKSQFLSTVMFEDPDILQVAGKAAEGVIYTASAFDPQSKDEVVKTFVQDFRKKYGVEPDVFAALSYDSAQILIYALRRGGTNGPAIRDTLYALRDHQGVMGRLHFDQNGDVVIEPVVKTVRDGAFVRISRVSSQE